MADGSLPIPLFDRDEAGELRLLATVGLDRHLVAKCASPRCGRTAACDPTPWVAEGLGALPLRTFSERMRCVCGSRQAWLEVWPGPFAPAARPDIHVFR